MSQPVSAWTSFQVSQTHEGCVSNNLLLLASARAQRSQNISQMLHCRSEAYTQLASDPTPGTSHAHSSEHLDICSVSSQSQGSRQSAGRAGREGSNYSCNRWIGSDLDDITYKSGPVSAAPNLSLAPDTTDSTDKTDSCSEVSLCSSHPIFANTESRACQVPSDTSYTSYTSDSSQASQVSQVPQVSQASRDLQEQQQLQESQQSKLMQSACNNSTLPKLTKLKKLKKHPKDSNLFLCDHFDCFEKSALHRMHPIHFKYDAATGTTGTTGTSATPATPKLQETEQPEQVAQIEKSEMSEMSGKSDTTTSCTDWSDFNNIDIDKCAQFLSLNSSFAVDTQVLKKMDKMDQVNQVSKKVSSAKSVAPTATMTSNAPANSSYSTVLGLTSDGVVLKGIDKRSNSMPVAIKIVPIRAITSYEPSCECGILREKRVLEVLSNCKDERCVRGIARLLEFLKDDKYYYLITEYGGVDLFDATKKQFDILNDLSQGNSQKWTQSFLTWRGMVRVIFVQLVELMTHLHNDHNIAHLDVSMENILLGSSFDLNKIGNEEECNVTRDINVKLIDFEHGVHAVQDGCQVWRNWAKWYTSAPEVLDIGINGYNAFGADIWALGSNLVAMVTGGHSLWKQAQSQLDASQIDWERLKLINNDIVKCGLVRSETFQKSGMTDWFTKREKDLLEKILVREDMRLNISQVFEHSYVQRALKRM